MLEILEIEPTGKTKGAVIWLHGLGADGHDFEPLVRDWGLAESQGIRFILPHAPRQPVTLNGGMEMRAWYDLYDLTFDNGEDTEGIERARQMLLSLVAREVERGVPTGRILLAGFSQGAAVVLHTALRMAEPLAGVLVLSGYLPRPGTLAAEKQADPQRLAIRIDHGEQDPVVPFAAAERTRKALEALGYKVDFHAWPMQHSLCPAQVRSLRSWIAEKLD
ncbi:phospholipase/carboxylesterase [Thiogranum longum]|uniref:Phospholipase/carboxylesterase n=1 Tax=Thiogranum longum TaxID=1537524 RepID=A0A4R1H549_9GAMM|nr:alpha/beta fold hydrolase [Thiogranum longum]TCK16827.1 phospholipase/carboxylesterase [Thiogranum longum]